MTPKNKWFEKHQGLITFFGYLITIVITGISVAYSIYVSNSSLKLSRKQFNYEVSKDSSNKIASTKVDSLNKIETAKSDLESKKKFKYQDSLNKNQNEINREQLNNFKAQTLTGEEQLAYFKKQTQIAETQLKRADIIYQEQLNENKPYFLLQDFTIDSIKFKPNFTINCNVFNSGKRDAYIKKVSFFAWSPESDLLFYADIPIDGKAFPPTAKTSFFAAINNKIELNEKTIIMYQIFYEDKLLRDSLTYKMFFRFDEFKPINTVQVDEDVQLKLLNRISKAEQVDNKRYLTF
jgi:hypothetical protein